MKRKILLTGASGLLGSAVLNIIKNNKNYSIIGIYNNNKPMINGTNISFLQGDLTEKYFWKKIDNFNDIYAVIHCAAVVPKSFKGKALNIIYRRNSKMDRYAILYAFKKNVRLTYLSGTSIYGLHINKKINENYKLNPVGAYIKGKAKSENLIIKNNKLKYFILRVSSPYGKYQRSNTVLNIFIKNALSNMPLIYYGSGERRQDFTYANDVAKACLLSLENEKYGIYNIASGKSVSMKELAGLIKRMTNSKSQIKPAGIPDPQELYRPLFDISKAKMNLNWEPNYPLEKGIKEFIKYITNN